jgi:hypothetical protein
MHEQSNMPMSPEPAGIAGWFSTWMTAVTKPNEETFARLAEHPDARTNSRAFTWVFLAGTVSALISGILQALVGLMGFVPQTPGLSELFGGDANRGFAFTLGIAVCSSPVAGAIGALFFVIGVGVIQWVAKLFKGTGTFSQLAYAIAAISVPFTLVSAFLTPFSSVPVLGICTGILSLGLGIYALVLQLMAVKGVNKFGWGQAAGSVFLPGLVFACCLIVVVAVLAGMGVAMGDVFNSIQNTLP